MGSASPAARAFPNATGRGLREENRSAQTMRAGARTALPAPGDFPARRACRGRPYARTVRGRCLATDEKDAGPYGIGKQDGETGRAIRFPVGSWIGPVAPFGLQKLRCLAGNGIPSRELRVDIPVDPVLNDEDGCEGGIPPRSRLPSQRRFPRGSGFRSGRHLRTGPSWRGDSPVCRHGSGRVVRHDIVGV